MRRRHRRHGRGRRRLAGGVLGRGRRRNVERREWSSHGGVRYYHEGLDGLGDGDGCSRLRLHLCYDAAERYGLIHSGENLLV
jgi:hypothetical protein